MRKTEFSPEVRERAVCMVQEVRGDYRSLCTTVGLLAPKIGYTPTTLLRWVKRTEIDSWDNGKFRRRKEERT